MQVSTEERLEKAEKRLAELENLVTYLMKVAAKHPLGRKILEGIAKAGRE